MIKYSMHEINVHRLTILCGDLDVDKARRILIKAMREAGHVKREINVEKSNILGLSNVFIDLNQGPLAWGVAQEVENSTEKISTFKENKI